MINGNYLNRKNYTKDLGIFYDEQLKFDKHLIHVINKANKNLAFVKRSTLHFKNIDPIKSLYISIERPVMIYGDIIWRPNKKVSINKIEQIQHKMLRYLAFKDNLNFPRFCHNYDSLYEKYNLPSISSIFRTNDAILLYKIMQGKIKCNNIKDNLPLNKRVSKNSMHFYPKFSLNKPFEKEPCFRLCTIGNNMIVKKPMLAKFDLELNAIINLLKLMYYEYFHKK